MHVHVHIESNVDNQQIVKVMIRLMFMQMNIHTFTEHNKPTTVVAITYAFDLYLTMRELEISDFVL